MLSCGQLLSIVLIAFTWKCSRGSEHCPALSMDFNDFGINFCSTSPLVRNLEDAEKLLHDAKCLGWVQWDMDPFEGCKSPEVKEGMEFEYPCHCDFNGTCKLHCGHDYNLLGGNTITCLKNGSWSFLPSCVKKKCKKPELPPKVKIVGKCTFAEDEECEVACADASYHIVGDHDSIKCHKEKWPEHFPTCEKFCKIDQIPKELVSDSSCTTNVLGVCPVSCKHANHTLNGAHILTCTAEGKWSDMPTCGCSPSFIPHGVEVNDCTYEAGKSCKARCEDNYYLKKDSGNELKCNAEGAWDKHASIHCFPMCPEPQIPSTMEIVGQCNARIGDVCKVRCKNEKIMRISGPDTFYCQPTGDYSQIPGCSEAGQCPKTVIPSTLKFVGECYYTIGTTCVVVCINEIATLEGPTSVTCLATGNWSPFPTCKIYCTDFPIIPGAQSQPSGRVTAGNHIIYTCMKDYYPDTPILVVCKDDGKFSEVIFCEKRCPRLDLKNKFIIKSACTHSGRAGMSKCTLGCRERDHAILPTDQVECLAGAVWSPMPKCMKTCDTHDFNPNFKIVASCHRFLVGQRCMLECSDKTKTLIGTSYATCEDHKVHVSLGTKCVRSCPKLDLPVDLDLVEESFPCEDALEGSTCGLYCNDRQATLIGYAKITCLHSGQWSPFPTCQYFCPPPLLKSNTHMVGPCHQDAAAQCRVECNDPEQTIDGKPYAILECELIVWSRIGDCESVCKEPNLHDSVMIRGICSYRPLKQCTVICKDPEATMFGSPIIKCLEDGTWLTGNPSCTRVCGHPHFPSGVDFAHKSCSMTVGSFCQIRCTERYFEKMEKIDAIECLPSLSWSFIPFCARPCPTPPGIRFAFQCRGFARLQCTALCSEGYIPSYGNPTSLVMLCQEDGTWREILHCEAAICKLPPDLEPGSDCQLTPGSFCTVKCIDSNKKLVGDPKIMCAPNFIYPIYPKCEAPIMTCMPFDFSTSKFTPATICIGPFAAYYKCKVQCEPNFQLIGQDFIMCEPGGNWGKLPICVLKCFMGDLPLLYRRSLALCLARPHVDGEYCAVVCADREYILADTASAFCSSGTWTRLPRCMRIPRNYNKNCRMSDVPRDLVLHDVPDSQHFAISCRDPNYVLLGPQITICDQDRYKWTQLPFCELAKPTAKCPVFPFHSCDKRDFGESCTYVEYACGTPILKTSYCLSSETWSSSSRCKPPRFELQAELNNY